LSETTVSKEAFLRNIAAMKWREFPGHFRGALSKELVSRALVGTRRIDFRISHYQPMAHVEEHVHGVQEQVYFVLEGEGLLTLDGVESLLRTHDYVWIPPGIRHSFTACGLVPLVFLVLTSPAEDAEVPV
jgi:mannose-6-phosphate isomerase-like protein (cupin superfamily)